MIAKLRVTGLTLLALVVPTLALGGETPPPGPQGLSVGAALDGCGLAETTIVCRIDTSWSALEDADYYTVSVTTPDGSVVDAGQSGGTSHLIVVPYVGPGTYSVQVTAWGTPPGKDEPEVVGQGEAGSPEPKDATGAPAALPRLLDTGGVLRTGGDTPGEAPDEADLEAPPPALEPEPCDEASRPEPAQPEPAQPELAQPEQDVAPQAADETDATEEPVAEDEPDVAPVCP